MFPVENTEHQELTAKGNKSVNVFKGPLFSYSLQMCAASPEDLMHLWSKPFPLIFNSQKLKLGAWFITDLHMLHTLAYLKDI